jgi:pimeloyl-ACP methyl ester carboxylesterase
MTSPTRIAEANGISIAYETIGNPSNPPVLLVMGLGGQMIAWPDELCEALVVRRVHVIRFDNRDVGLSTHFSKVPIPSPVGALVGAGPPPYRIADMADDAVGLLGALGIESAHVVGASMGGFIAQTLALRHPTRVRSLTLIMTSTGSRLVGLPKPKVLARMARRRTVVDRASAVDALVETFRLIGSPGYPFDESAMRDLGARSFDRSFDPGGYLRQMAAISAQQNRTRALFQVRVPTVVLHGLDDPLVGVSGGLAVARAIRGSRFVGFPGMGHDLPRALWPQFTAEIHDVIAAGEAQRASGR